MILRVWVIFFTLALGTAFRYAAPNKTVVFPLSEEFHEVPADVFYYYLWEHVGKIIIAVLLISMYFYPPSRIEMIGYIGYFSIELADVIFWRLFYRGWWFDAIPWNVTKNLILLLYLLNLTVKKNE